MPGYGKYRHMQVPGLNKMGVELVTTAAAVCELCGSIIQDEEAHTKWHAILARNEVATIFCIAGLHDRCTGTTTLGAECSCVCHTKKKTT